MAKLLSFSSTFCAAAPAVLVGAAFKPPAPNTGWATISCTFGSPVHRRRLTPSRASLRAASLPTSATRYEYPQSPAIAASMSAGPTAFGFGSVAPDRTRALPKIRPMDAATYVRMMRDKVVHAIRRKMWWLRKVVVQHDGASAHTGQARRTRFARRASGGV